VNAKFFEEQRREMVAVIRAIAEHVAPQIGKTTLDERVLRAMAKVPREEFVPIEVQSYAYLNRLNQFHRRNLFSMAISVWSTLSITAILAK
jgi:protein-L-isoaspartate O-methyltransferase